MKSLFLILGVLAITHLGLWSQAPKTQNDAKTLNANIQKMKDSPEKVNSLLDLSAYFENVSIDTAILYYDKTYQVAKKIDDKEGILKYASNQSYMYNLMGNFEKGLEINQMAYQTALELNNKTKELSALGNIGISYSYLNEYEKSIERYQKALDIALSINDHLRAAKIYGVIAGTYNNMGQSITADSILFLKSIDYGKKALKISRTLKDSVLLSDNLIAIALAYNNLEKMSDAKPYAEEAKIIAQNIGQTNNYAHALSVLAKIARNNKQYVEAIRMANEAVALQKDMGSIMGQAISLKELSLCYKYADDYSKAVSTINDAILLAENQDMGYILDGMYLNKAEYLYELKQYKEAYEFLSKGQTLSDSLRGLEVKSQVNELEKKYETAKKEQEILKLSSQKKRQQWLIMSLFLSLLALGVISYIWKKNASYRTRIIEQEKDQLLKEKQLQATASIIKGQEDERHRLAKDLHDGLGGMLSGLKYTLNNMGDNMVLSGRSVDSFNNALSMLDQAIVEMRKVAHNMMPESLLKFGLDETLKDYVSKMNASSSMQIHYQTYNYQRLDSTFEINIYRIIQEVINNAMKHSKATDMYIQMDFQKDHLHLTIEDNGIGFDPTVENSKSGIGLKNIADRVSFMNGTLEISSSEGKGTLFVIEIQTPQT